MRKIFLGLAAVAAVASTPALAATATNSMPVSVNVINSCTVAATPMAFGAPAAIGGANIDTTSTISLVCTNGASYDVALDMGLNAASGQRYLSNGAATPVTIPYNVYRDAGRSTSWGSASGTDTNAGTAGTSGLVVLTAYGRIPMSATSVGAGAYTDTVTVTVTF
ncbi:MAG: spore coat U domain-containing protein [Novosphingobium sp.]|nr:spore coat U domain-containing protein [Novosphingobium sp.]